MILKTFKAMEINIPHVHKIEGDAGFWAKVTKEGKVEELKMQTHLGLRQIEGILVGRKVKDVPLVVSRICGICPVVHILNGTVALEKALGIGVSPETVLLRKLFLASQIIQSNALHLFFMALPDFLNIENDLKLSEKFPKESEAAMKMRDYALAITEIIGGRVVHPVTPRVGGFSKAPDKKEFEKLLNGYPEVLKGALLLAEKLGEIDYPDFNRETVFASLYSEKEYPYYQSELMKIGEEKISIGDFYSNKIEEDFKNPPVKKVTFKGKEYMLGSIARIKNNGKLLNPKAKEVLSRFIRKRNLKEGEFFNNVFYNLFCQAVEAVHFTEESQKLLKEAISFNSVSSNAAAPVNAKGKGAAGLSAMEAPRGTLFDYFETDKEGRVSHCNIITPTAQFLNNLEHDLKTLLPKLVDLPAEERIKKVRSLVRVYDPCISCATH
jgi:coenzyme F420-reducing hydrogenase alpha subunit